MVTLEKKKIDGYNRKKQSCGYNREEEEWLTQGKGKNCSYIMVDDER